MSEGLWMGWAEERTREAADSLKSIRPAPDLPTAGTDAARGAAEGPTAIDGAVTAADVKAAPAAKAVLDGPPKLAINLMPEKARLS